MGIPICQTPPLSQNGGASISLLVGIPFCKTPPRRASQNGGASISLQVGIPFLQNASVQGKPEWWSFHILAGGHSILPKRSPAQGEPEWWSLHIHLPLA
jgi:hypothetical protein